jgi:phage terminase large subunit
MTPREAFEEKLRHWRYHPYDFTVEVLGAKELKDKDKFPNIKVITTQQREVLEDLGKLALSKKKFQLGHALSEAEKLYIKKTGLSIKSGKGSGKTALLAWVVIWFLCCFSFSIVICTASKLDQVKDVLWREISKWVKHSVDHGKYGTFVKDSMEIKGEKIYMKGHKGQKGQEWFAIARSATTQKQGETPAETLQGFHAEHMMIIVDEATGVSDNVFMPLDQTLTDPVNFLVMTYNPTRTSGFAYQSQHKNRNEFLCYRWNCEESENVTQESIDRIARKYGKDSNAYRISVQGLEPIGDNDSLIPLEWVMAAVNREIDVDEDDPVITGIDLARHGDDKSVILTRRGMKVDNIIKTFNGQNTMEMCGWISIHNNEEEPTCMGIDVVGLGWGVYDRLREVGIRCTAINVAESTSNKDKFERLRDELWWALREDFQLGNISIPDDEELIFELSNVKFRVESNGKIKVESKKEMRARGVASPNKADALVLTKYFNDRTYRKLKLQKSDYFDDYEDNFSTNSSWITA